MGNSDAPGVISLNAYWFAAPRARFDEAVVAGRAAQRPGLPKWHGGIGDLDREFDRLLTHEFGHHLMAHRGRRASVFAKAGHSATVADPALAVSGYATVDAQEWFADTFAASRLGGAGSPQVADVLELLESNK